jgi:hypothetical protein
MLFFVFRGGRSHRLAVCECYLHGWMDRNYTGHQVIDTDLEQSTLTVDSTEANANVLDRNDNASEGTKMLCRRDSVICRVNQVTDHD